MWLTLHEEFNADWILFILGQKKTEDAYVDESGDCCNCDGSIFTW